jgi:transposase InsO family protein
VQLTALLGARGCRFEAGDARGRGLHIKADGTVAWGGTPWKLAEHGFPGEPVEVPARYGGRVWGRFVLDPTLESARFSPHLDVQVGCHRRLGLSAGRIRRLGVPCRSDTAKFPVMSAIRPSRQDLEVAITQLRTEARRRCREIQHLRTENEVLREAAEPLIHRAPARERFAFIHLLRDRFSVKRLCRILVTDRGSFYGWVRAQTRRDQRAYDEQDLTERIVEIHTAHPAYGAERVTRELKRHRIEVGRQVVTRLMRANGISGITRRKRRNLTRPDADAAAVPDLIRRQFSAPMPGLKMIGDISCFPTGEGWLYLATVLDLCTKELIGHAIAPRIRAQLAIDAIAAAHRTGSVAGNAIMHAERGSQYHPRPYQNALRRLEIRQSTGRTGSCLDGAAAESFFATIKTEIGTDAWPDRTTARRDIENWITQYNERRLHSAIGYQTPAETRRAWQKRMAVAV